MANAAISPGAHGKAMVNAHEDGRVALLVLYRSLDGSATWQVKASGASRAAAERTLTRNIAASEAKHAKTMSAALASAQHETSLETAIYEMLDSRERKGKLRPQTMAEYRRMAGARIIPAVGHWQVATVLPETIEAYLDAIHAEIPGSYNAIRTLLTQTFRRAVHNQRRTDNPVREIEYPAKTEKLPVVVSVSEVTSLRNVLTDLQNTPPRRPRPKTRYADVRDVLDTMLAAGLRIGEALALRWSSLDLDSDKPHLNVVSTVVFLKGRGHFLQDVPKTASSNRGVYLEHWAVDMLRARRTEAKSDLVFPSRTGSVWSPANVNSILRGQSTVPGSIPSPRTLAGLPKLVPHSFRRTFATAVDAEYGYDVSGSAIGHAKGGRTTGRYLEKAELGPDVRSALTKFAPKAPENTGPDGSVDKGN